MNRITNISDEFFKAWGVLKISRGILLKNPLDLTFSSLIKLIPDKLLSSRACFRFI